VLLSDDGTAGLLPLLTTQSGPLLDWASRRLADTIDEHWPGVARSDLDMLADALVRLAISHVTAPRDPPARTAAAVTRLLAPSIEQMIVAAGARTARN
jgi:Bacterial Tetracyclin repressor,  C-terminal domain